MVGTLKLIAAVAVFLAIISAFYLWVNLRTADKDSDARIFAAATSQLGIDSGGVRYFRIFGDDRVQFSTGGGANFAYLENGSWHRAGPADLQAVPLCAEFSSVPERFREGCYDEAARENRYLDASGQNINYPALEMRTYREP